MWSKVRPTGLPSAQTTKPAQPQAVRAAQWPEVSLAAQLVARSVPQQVPLSALALAQQVARKRKRIWTIQTSIIPLIATILPIAPTPTPTPTTSHNTRYFPHE